MIVGDGTAIPLRLPHPPRRRRLDPFLKRLVLLRHRPLNLSDESRVATLLGIFAGQGFDSLDNGLHLQPPRRSQVFSPDQALGFLTGEPRIKHTITIPGLMKIEKKKVPARPAQTGVPNPFKPGELMDRPAKPAYSKVKVRALKLLKDMAK